MVVSGLHYDWHPSPEVVAGELDLIDANLSDASAPLAASREIVIQQEVGFFATESGPEGAWAPWVRDYTQEGSESILRKTGALFEAATSPDNFHISPNVLTWQPGGGEPPYWMFHQEGTSKMEARPFLGLTPETEAEIFSVFEAWFSGAVTIAIGAGGGPGRAQLQTRSSLGTIMSAGTFIGQLNL